MGGDIAAWSATKGFEVTLLNDREQRFIDARCSARAGPVREGEGRGERPEIRRLESDLAGDGVADAGPGDRGDHREGLDAKRGCTAAVEPRMKADALLATNTSSIPLDRLREHIARAVRRPALLQPGRADAAGGTGPPRPEMAPRTQERLAAFCGQLDKLPVPVAGSPASWSTACCSRTCSGDDRLRRRASPGPVIDKAAVKFGMPMGPIELVDTVGLTWARASARNWRPSRPRHAPPLQSPVEPASAARRTTGPVQMGEKGKPSKAGTAEGLQGARGPRGSPILPLVNGPWPACTMAWSPTPTCSTPGDLRHRLRPSRGGPDPSTCAKPASMRCCNAPEFAAGAPRPALRRGRGWDNPALKA